MSKTKAKAATTITRDDWMRALQETVASQVDTDPGLLTYDEFAELTGCAIGTARRHLTALVASGRAIRTTKRKLAEDGRCRRMVAYRLVQKS